MTPLDAMKQALTSLESCCMNHGSTIASLRAAIEEMEKAEPVAYLRSAPIPEGWQLVPKEPTKTMLAAGWGNDHLYAGLYKAVLAVAPKPGEGKS